MIFFFLHFGWFSTYILQDFDRIKKLSLQWAWRNKTEKRVTVFFSVRNLSFRLIKRRFFNDDWLFTEITNLIYLSVVKNLTLRCVRPGNYSLNNIQRNQKLRESYRIHTGRNCFNMFQISFSDKFWQNGWPDNGYFWIPHKISGLLTPLTPLGVPPQWFETDLSHWSWSKNFQAQIDATWVINYIIARMSFNQLKTYILYLLRWKQKGT